MKTEKRKAASTESECLRESINVKALLDLASRRHSAQWRPAGQGAPLRAIIMDFVAQAKHGFIKSIWREEVGMTNLGLRGRRYSGYNKDQVQDGYFDALAGAHRVIAVDPLGTGRSDAPLDGTSNE